MRKSLQMRGMKYKSNIGLIDNMEYNQDEDYYICKNGRCLKVCNTITRKSKTGYSSVKTIYSCKDCTGCPYKSQCIKGNNCNTPIEERVKNLEVAKTFNKYRKETLERITSEEGCQLRMNRSIQAEGSFGELKQDMGYRRFLSKGKQNILAETGDGT